MKKKENGRRREEEEGRHLTEGSFNHEIKLSD